MKKLFVIAPLSIVLAACSSMSMPNPFKKGHSTTNMTSTEQTNKAYDRMAGERFSCEDNASVQVKYSIDGDEAVMTASLPKAKWENQTLTLNIAQSGSGSRYTNDTVSDNVSYDWQTKGDMGIMSMQWANGQEYSVTCKRVS